MIRVEPKIFLLARTMIDIEGVHEFLKSQNAEGWDTECDSDSEYLVEMAGRACYRSWKPGLNPNVTKVREGNDVYLGNILKSRHGSVLEHASVTFAFVNVSRVFTHELVRHRAGCAISQESLRYVRLTDIKQWYPSCIQENPAAVEVFNTLIEAAENAQVVLTKLYGLDDEESFATKKEITSAMRRIAPDGLATTIIWTANFRTLRHVLEMRSSRHAEEEIRIVFQEVGRILKERFPNLFQDFTQNEAGEWIPEYSKI